MTEHLTNIPEQDIQKCFKARNKRMKKCITTYRDLFNENRLKFCNFSIVTGSAEI